MLLSSDPNYFGEWLFWLGLWLLGGATVWSWSSLGPAIMTVLFGAISIKLMEVRNLHTCSGFSTPPPGGGGGSKRIVKLAQGVLRANETFILSSDPRKGSKRFEEERLELLLARPMSCVPGYCGDRPLYWRLSNDTICLIHDLFDTIKSCILTCV